MFGKYQCPLSIITSTQYYADAQRLTVVRVENNKVRRMDPIHPPLQPPLVNSEALPRAISMEDLPYPRSTLDATRILPPGRHCPA